MTKRAVIRRWAMLAGALIGAYMAAMNCPAGWWMNADFRAGSERIIGGVIVGIIVGWAVGSVITSRREKSG